MVRVHVGRPTFNEQRNKMPNITSWAIALVLIALALQAFDFIPITSGLLFLSGLSFIPGLRTLIKKTKIDLPIKKRRLLYGILAIVIIIITYKEVQYKNEQAKESARLEKVAQKQAELDKKKRISREVQRLRELREQREKKL